MSKDLVYSNLYEYDFTSCGYNILKNMGWDVSKIEYNNKIKRNIQIGYLLRDNSTLNDYMQKAMNDLIDIYLRENNILEEDIILRQKDGMVISKRLEKKDVTMPIDFRGLISKLIFTVDRKSWIIIYYDDSNSKDVVVKGLRDKTIDTSFFNHFKYLNYTNINALISGLESLRNVILTSDNKLWFCKEDGNGNYLVPIIGQGLMKMNKSAISFLSSDDIDKSFVWSDYVWPYVRSLLIYCTEKRR